MQTNLTPDRVRTVVSAADTAARRLEWRLRMPRGEREDLRQDLLIDLIRRVPDYDPGRGSFEAFTQVVLTHGASRIASRILAERRVRGVQLSLHHPVGADPRPLSERLVEEDGLWSWLGHEVADETRVELGHDVARALGLLCEPDRQLCSGLASLSVTALVRSGSGSRSALYRRIADLRCVLTAHGLGPAWDDFAAA
jgi:RNA polymerase sigma-70 factor (ECF subfamily)